MGDLGTAYPFEELRRQSLEVFRRRLALPAVLAVILVTALVVAFTYPPLADAAMFTTVGSGFALFVAVTLAAPYLELAAEGLRLREFLGDQLLISGDEIRSFYSMDRLRRFRARPETRELPPTERGAQFYELLTPDGLTVESSYRPMSSRGTVPGSLERRVAPVAPCEPRRARFYSGRPPRPGGRDSRKELAPAASLIFERQEGYVYLCRLDEQGRYAGQTWHPDTAAAEAQIAYEFAGAVGNWLEMSPTGRNPRAEAVKLLRRQQGGSRPDPPCAGSKELPGEETDADPGTVAE